MTGTVPDEEYLLALLNSTPVVAGQQTDVLADPARASGWVAGYGGEGSEEELRQVKSVRAALQAVVRGEQAMDVLSPALAGVASVPAVAGGQITWTLSVPPERWLAVRAVLAWGTLNQLSPGRLRPCANDECRLFLIDHSNANGARWCSMAGCGNRMKARRHYQRGRSADAG